MSKWQEREYDALASGSSAHSYISEENARRVMVMGKGSKHAIGEVASLADLARDWGADPDETDKIIAEYLSKRNPYHFHRAARKIFKDAYGLSDDFVDLNYGIDDLLTVVQEAQFRGNLESIGEFFEDPKRLAELKKAHGRGGGGLPAAKRKILKPDTAKLHGIPPGVELTVAEMDKGVVLAQQYGIDEAIGSPEYWKDFKTMNPQQLVLKHQKKLEGEAARQSAEFDKKFKEYLKTKLYADVDLELERRRRQREKESQEKLRRREQRRRKARKKKKLYRLSPIITPWGVYTLVIFFDGDTAIVAREKGKIRVLLPKGNWAYNAYVDDVGNLYGTPMIGRRVGNRRAPPVKAPSRVRGPIGR